MDLFNAYRLIQKNNKDSENNTQPHKKVIQKDSCSNCGQNTYWCQCSNNNLRNSNDNSELYSSSMDIPRMVRSFSFGSNSN